MPFLHEDGNTIGKELDTMEEVVQKHIEDCIRVKKQLVKTSSKLIVQIAEEIIRAYRKSNKVLWFGNGGSAADAQHLSCELLSKFYTRRQALESLALTTNTSVVTATKCIGGCGNDRFLEEQECLYNRVYGAAGFTFNPDAC